MLVLLPGMDGTGILFEPVLQCLANTVPVRVIRYPPTTASYADLVALVLQQLPEGEPMTLVAESFSGPIALEVSANPALNVGAVVFVSSFAGEPLGKWGVALSYLPIAPFLRLAGLRKVIRQFLLDNSAPQEVVDLARTAISSRTPRCLASRVKAALTHRCIHLPGSRSTRVIAIYAKRDKILGAAARRSILHACPETEEHWVDAPHFAAQAAPEEIVEILRTSGVFD